MKGFLFSHTKILWCIFTSDGVVNQFASSYRSNNVVELFVIFSI